MEVESPSTDNNDDADADADAGDAGAAADVECDVVPFKVTLTELLMRAFAVLSGW